MQTDEIRIYEMDYWNSISLIESLKDIARELKKANKLKAIELKGHLDLKLDSKMVDEIMENES